MIKKQNSCLSWHKKPEELTLNMHAKLTLKKGTFVMQLYATQCQKPNYMSSSAGVSFFWTSTLKRSTISSQEGHVKLNDISCFCCDFLFYKSWVIRFHLCRWSHSTDQWPQTINQQQRSVYSTSSDSFKTICGLKMPPSLFFIHHLLLSHIILQRFHLKAPQDIWIRLVRWRLVLSQGNTFSGESFIVFIILASCAVPSSCKCWESEENRWHE